ncbi:hypothetical protein KCU65_g2772, partial [Aureobasidium melanogenum]
MSTDDYTILGLRAQILENWRYAHPENANVVIVISRERSATRRQDNNTPEPKESPEETEMKRFHNALGHVIDLASRK